MSQAPPKRTSGLLVQSAIRGGLIAAMGVFLFAVVPRFVNAAQLAEFELPVLTRLIIQFRDLLPWIFGGLGLAFAIVHIVFLKPRAAPKIVVWFLVAFAVIGSAAAVGIPWLRLASM